MYGLRGRADVRRHFVTGDRVAAGRRGRLPGQDRFLVPGHGRDGPRRARRVLEVERRGVPEDADLEVVDVARERAAGPEVRPEPVLDLRARVAGDDLRERGRARLRRAVERAGADVLRGEPRPVDGVQRVPRLPRPGRDTARDEDERGVAGAGAGGIDFDIEGGERGAAGAVRREAERGDVGQRRPARDGRGARGTGLACAVLVVVEPLVLAGRDGHRERAGAAGSGCGAGHEGVRAGVARRLERPRAVRRDVPHSHDGGCRPGRRGDQADCSQSEQRERDR